MVRSSASRAVGDRPSVTLQRVLTDRDAFFWDFSLCARVGKSYWKTRHLESSVIEVGLRPLHPLSPKGSTIATSCSGRASTSIGLKAELLTRNVEHRWWQSLTQRPNEAGADRPDRPGPGENEPRT